MRQLTLLALLIVAGTTSQAHAHDSSNKQRCENTKQKIRKIHSEMRSGYSASRGIKLEARLRELRELRRKQCR